MFATSESDIDVDQLMREIRETVAQGRAEKTLQHLDGFAAELAALKESIPGIEAHPLELQPAFHPHPDDHYHINDLLKYHGVDFVRNAYLAILKRGADGPGLEAHLQNLASGRLNKIDVLAAVAYSPEAKQTDVRIDGLKWPARLRQLQRIPVLGYFLEIAIALARMPVLHRNFRQVEFHGSVQRQLIVDQIFRLHEQVNHMAARFSALETAVERVTAAELNHLESLTRRQEELNTLQAEFADQTRGQLDTIANQLSSARVALNDDIEAIAQRLKDHSAQISAGIKQTDASLNQTSDRVETLKRNMAMQERRISAFIDSVNEHDVDREPMAAAIDAERAHMLDGLYAAFEDEFRGSRQEIKDRLRVYLPLIKQAGITKGVLDVGCGRGEWLELMKEEGIGARGVDWNRVAVARCRDAGLVVEESDAVVYLRGLEDAALNLITSFHVIEHLPFETLIKLLDECVRVLARGGLLILETPNPENFMVGSHTFYTDPTHRNPIPSLTLKFLLEARGLSRTEVIKLRPWDAAKIEGDSEIINRFNEYFYGAPDYAIAAWKD